MGGGAQCLSGIDSIVNGLAVLRRHSVSVDPFNFRCPTLFRRCESGTAGNSPSVQICVHAMLMPWAISCCFSGFTLCRKSNGGTALFLNRERNWQ
jgi:hypothetical protein